MPFNQVGAVRLQQCPSFKEALEGCLLQNEDDDYSAYWSHSCSPRKQNFNAWLHILVQARVCRMCNSSLRRYCHANAL